MSAAATHISLSLNHFHWPLALAVALALGACSQQNDSPAASPASAAPADQTRQPDLARLGLEELRKRGRLALREQRIYAPAGNNAMEYYIALRDGSETGDDPAASALMELQPYAVIAAEQALERKDFVEAARLRRLVAASDPRAPSLARIASAIAIGLGNQAQETSEAEPQGTELERIVETEPASLPPGRAATDAPVPTAPVVASPPLSAAPPVGPRVPAAVVVRQPVAAAITPPQSKPARVELVAVRTPPPEYPNEKRPRGAVGQVIASFTVNSDGSVGDVRTESLGSKHMAFERSVARTVKRWKYQPPGESRDVTVSFDFAP